MADLNKIFDNVNVATVASDPDLNVKYANKRCKEVFKALLNQEDFVGKKMRECHQPETIEKISALYEEYRQKKKHWITIPWISLTAKRPLSMFRCTTAISS